MEKAVLGELHSELRDAETYEFDAQAFAMDGQMSQASDLYETALLLRIQCLGRSHASVLHGLRCLVETRNKCARIEMCSGGDSTACVDQLKALLSLLADVRVHSFEEELTPCLHLTLNTLASLHRRLGNIPDSLSCFHEAVALCPRLPKVDVATTHLGLCSLYSELGQYDESELHAVAAVEFCEAAILQISHSSSAAELNEQVMTLAVAYNNLAVQREHLGKSSEALDLYEKSVVLAQSLQAPCDFLVRRLKESHRQAYTKVASSNALTSEGTALVAHNGRQHAHKGKLVHGRGHKSRPQASVDVASSSNAISASEHLANLLRLPTPGGYFSKSGAGARVDMKDSKLEVSTPLETLRLPIEAFESVRSLPDKINNEVTERSCPASKPTTSARSVIGDESPVDVIVDADNSSASSITPKLRIVGPRDIDYESPMDVAIDTENSSASSITPKLPIVGPAVAEPQASARLGVETAPSDALQRDADLPIASKVAADSKGSAANAEQSGPHQALMQARQEVAACSIQRSYKHHLETKRQRLEINSGEQATERNSAEVESQPVTTDLERGVAIECVDDYAPEPEAECPPEVLSVLAKDAARNNIAFRDPMAITGFKGLERPAEIEHGVLVQSSGSPSLVVPELSKAFASRHIVTTNTSPIGAVLHNKRPDPGLNSRPSSACSRFGEPSERPKIGRSVASSMPDLALPDLSRTRSASSLKLLPGITTPLGATTTLQSSLSKDIGSRASTLDIPMRHGSTKLEPLSSDYKMSSVRKDGHRFLSEEPRIRPGFDPALVREVSFQLRYSLYSKALLRENTAAKQHACFLLRRASYSLCGQSVAKEVHHADDSYRKQASRCDATNSLSPVSGSEKPYRTSAASSKILVAISLSDDDEAYLMHSRPSTTTKSPLTSPKKRQRRVRLDLTSTDEKDSNELKSPGSRSDASNVTGIASTRFSSPERMDVPVSPSVCSDASKTRSRRESKLASLQSMAAKSRTIQIGVGKKPRVASDKLPPLSSQPEKAFSEVLAPENLPQENFRPATAHDSVPHCAGNAMTAISRLRSARAALLQSTLANPDFDDSMSAHKPSKGEPVGSASCKDVESSAESVGRATGEVRGSADQAESEMEKGARQQMSEEAKRKKDARPDPVVSDLLKQMGIRDDEIDAFGLIAERGLQRDLLPSRWDNPNLKALQSLVSFARRHMERPMKDNLDAIKESLWHDHKTSLQSWFGPVHDLKGVPYYVNLSGDSSWQDPREEAQFAFDLECILLDSLGEMITARFEEEKSGQLDAKDAKTAASTKERGVLRGDDMQASNSFRQVFQRRSKQSGSNLAIGAEISLASQTLPAHEADISKDETAVAPPWKEEKATSSTSRLSCALAKIRAVTDRDMPGTDSWEGMASTKAADVEAALKEDAIREKALEKSARNLQVPLQEESRTLHENLDASKSEANATVTFQPGPLGFNVGGREQCVIEQVHPGGQAAREGVKKGWRILAVGGKPCESFRDKVFQDAKNANVPYQVTFVKALVS